MQTAASAARKSSSTDQVPSGTPSGTLVSQVVGCLDDAKATNIVTIDIKKKSSIGDFMVVASGNSDRHVGAIAEQLREKLKDVGLAGVRVEGQQQCDWVLIDAGAVIVHVFRPEVREFYNIEKMWLADRPEEPPAH